MPCSPRFDRVVTSGAPELVLVSGYSGIGKSAVVHELHKALVPPRGLFASGKFDQYKRDIPYATLVQAFQSLVRPLLGQSEAELARWRETLLEALGPNGRLMTDLVPELSLVIGDQPPVPELAPQDAQRRFQRVFRRFIGVFARPEHPLALFLDDLQWLDAATLDLIEDLLTQADVRHLLLIGAYRDNEVDAAHPLMRKLAAIKTEGGKVAEITLAPLAQEHVGQLIADALRCEPQHAERADATGAREDGRQPVLRHSVSVRARREQLAGIRSWRRALDVGPRAHSRQGLHRQCGGPDGRQAHATARQTRRRRCSCWPVSATSPRSRCFRSFSGRRRSRSRRRCGRPSVRSWLSGWTGTYRFIHDRVQEAAYSLIPEASRAADHLRIGRLLVAHTPPEQREEAIFEIVSQLNRGATLITAREEREQLAEFNLIAGKRAKASYRLCLGAHLSRRRSGAVGGRRWERRHELIFALELDRAECEFLTGELTEAEQRLAALSSRAANTLERATVACLRMDLYTTLDQSSRAVAVGLDYLRHLGIDWSPHPTEEEARREYDRIWSQLGSRTIEALIDLPLMSDPASLATLDVLTKIGATGILHGCEPACPGHLPSGQSQPRARQLRRFMYRLRSAWHDRRRALRRLSGRVYRFGQLGYDLVEQTRTEAFPGQDLYALCIWCRCPGRDMSGPAAICCAARSRPQTRSATSLMPPIAATT